MKKFYSEKVLHEIIRDLPEAGKIDKALSMGLITIEEALETIAAIIKKEKNQ